MGHFKSFFEPFWGPCTPPIAATCRFLAKPMSIHYNWVNWINDWDFLWKINQIFEFWRILVILSHFEVLARPQLQQLAIFWPTHVYTLWLSELDQRLGSFVKNKPNFWVLKDFGHFGPFLAIFATYTATELLVGALGKPSMLPGGFT